MFKYKLCILNKGEKMNINNQNILSGSLIINEWGDYFDFLLNQDNNKEYITTIEDMKESSIILYPKKEEILNNFNKIKEKRPIIFLYAFQKEEIEILKTILKPVKLNCSDMYLKNYLNLDYSEEELLSIAKKHSQYKLAYIFVKLWNKFKWNPSWIKECLTADKYWKCFTFFNDLIGFEEYKLTNKYLNIAKEPIPRIIIELLFYDLTKEHNLTSEFFEKTTIKDYYNIKITEIKDFDTEKLVREGIIYEPKNKRFSLI